MAHDNTRTAATTDSDAADSDAADSRTTDAQDTDAQDTAPASAPPSEPAHSPPAQDHTVDAGAAGSVGAGATAAVGAGLGLASLTGTPLSDMLRSRQELVGQIDAAVGGGAGINQIDAIYGAPWNAAALVNGVFALLAVLLGAVALVVASSRPGNRSWVRPLALAGVALGSIGLVMAGAMYLDLFAAQPEIPAVPGLGG